jgi:hypothetical protein
LAARLSGYAVTAREEWSAETFRHRAHDYRYIEPDLAYVQESLYKALSAARDAIEEAAAKRRDLPEYRDALGRSLTPEDLSATLLLAVHTLVPYRGTSYSLVLALQVGDGIAAALHRNGKPTILGKPDSGQYAGETTFVSSTGTWGPAEVHGRITPYFSPMRALMVMTDGVSDDYLPFDIGLGRLYEELAKRGVVQVGGTRNEGAATHSGGPCTVRGVVGEPDEPGLAACAPSSADEAASRLVEWLDTYYVRGSFDDRTLVVLYPGAGP